MRRRKHRRIFGPTAAWPFRYVNSGVVRSVDAIHLREEIDDFSKRGLHGATLEIAGEMREIKVSLEKYISRRRKYGLDVILLFQQGRNKYANIIYDYCKSLGLETEFGQNSDVGHEEIIRIDCRQNLAKAHDLVAFALFDVLALPRDQALEMVVDGVSRWHEEIDSPYQLPRSEAEGSKFLKEFLRKKHGLGNASMAGLLLLLLCQIAGVLGVLGALLFASYGWDQVDILVSGTLYRAPLFGVISVTLAIVGLIGLPVIFAGTYWSAEIRNNLEGTIPIARFLAGRIVHYCTSPTSLITAALIILAIYTWIA